MSERPPASSATDPTRRAAYAHCLRVARHAENFPVASRLLPRKWRPHLAAVYAFARGADDLADEPVPRLGTRTIGSDRASRLAALDAWEAGLDGAPPPGSELVFEALAATRARCALSDRWLRALLDAFRQDVENAGFPTWTTLRAYADRSAAPVGRLVLEIAGRHDAPLLAASDDLCVALQWTNFWQDLARDWPRGRLYLPEEALGAATRATLIPYAGAALDPSRLPPPLARDLEAALVEAIARTSALYEAARHLPRAAGAPLARYLRAVWDGGRTVLDAVRRLGPRAFVERATLTPLQRGRLIVTAFARGAR